MCSPDRSNSIGCNGILGNIPNTDLFSMNHNNISLNGPTQSDDYLDHNDGNHYFTNKCMPMKSLDNTDYMIVSSEEIIDILDLTNDEVEQILDDNMISTQDFDTLNSPRPSQSMQQFNRMPRINFATNLTKIASPLMAEHEGKTIDMRPLETPTIDLDTNATETESTTLDTTKLITMMPMPVPMPAPVQITKKKSGRTKGARQISMFFFLLSIFGYYIQSPHQSFPLHLHPVIRHPTV